MLKKILIGVAVFLVVAVVGTVVLVAMQPDEFSVTRSATIQAPPATVFAQVNDLHAWQAWSPWIELDPSAKFAFSGPDAGEGAKFSWNGNDQMGAGDMTITESVSDERVRLDLHFIRPFEDTADVQFTFAPESSGEQTLVTWNMAGKHNLISKFCCLFMDMDTMIGSDFEKGLAKMKTAVESQQSRVRETHQ